MKKQYLLVGTDTPTALEQWMLEKANHMLDMDFGSVAFVGFPNDNNSDVCAYTANFGMSFPQLAEAANHLLFDSVDEFICCNLGRYRSMELNEDGRGIEPMYDPDEASDV